MITLEIEALKRKQFKTWFYLKNIRTGAYRARVAAELAGQAMIRFRQSMELTDEDIITVKQNRDDDGRPLCSFCNEPDPEDDFFKIHFCGFLGDMCQSCKEQLMIEGCMVYQKKGIWYAADQPKEFVRIEQFRKPLPEPKEQARVAIKLSGRRRKQTRKPTIQQQKKKAR